MAGPSQDERERTLELINEEFDKRLEQQARAGLAIDTKATVIVGFVVVAVQIFVGLKHTQPWATLAFLFLLVSFVSGVGTIALRKYTAFPRPQPVLDFYNEHSVAGTVNLRERVLGKLVGTKAEAVRLIGSQDETKYKTWVVMMTSFGVAIVMVVVSVLSGSPK